jgi:hypothetical protein
VSALVNQRELLVDALLAKGALRTNGAIDPRKLDAAFQAAVQGGLFPLVKKIWEAGGDLHPHLITRLDSPTEGTTKPRPVTDLLMQSAPARELQRPWTDVGITAWLTQQSPDEDTALELLHGAVDLRTTKEPRLELRTWAAKKHWDDVVSYLDTKP